MKHHLKAVFVAVVALAALAGCTKGYESSKTAGDLSIKLAASRYPLIKGDNDLTVKVADASGAAVKDAQVDVRYYMPAMPGMAPMEFRTQAAESGGAYHAKANIPMEGGWKVEVSVTQPGKPMQTATFNVDAR